MGNITKITNSSDDDITYTYDDLGQLISEVKGDVTRTYTYDNAGNIVSIEETKPKTIPHIPDFEDNTHWAFKPTETTTNTLGYSNSQWGDLLTSYNGTAITYDGIGNPLSYYNGTSYTFTWEGRRLVGAVKGTKTMSFAYNDEGIRTSKTVNGVTTTYYVNGGQIVAETTNTRTIVYIYDATGSPIGMMYRTTSYAEGAFDIFWYEKNLQGDIIAIYNNVGTKLATYTYTDAWGNFTVSYSNGGASTGAQYNPFRYRGYYYDTDLGMYYLQSRYYDAKICRFISADGYVSTGQGILGNNMFAYCNNNPVNRVDLTGSISFKKMVVFFAVIAGLIIVSTGVNHCINLANEKKIETELSDSYTQDEAKVAIDNYLSKYNNDSQIVQLEYTDAGFKIIGSYLVISRYDRQYVSMILSRTNLTNRDYDNLSAEWIGHNVMHFIKAQSSTADADLDYSGDSRLVIRIVSKVLELLGWE